MKVFHIPDPVIKCPECVAEWVGPLDESILTYAQHYADQHSQVDQSTAGEGEVWGEVKHFSGKTGKMLHHEVVK